MGMKKDSSDIEKVFHFLISCTHEIHYGDDVHRRIDLKDEEISDFIDQFTGEQFEMITEFFNSMPNAYGSGSQQTAYQPFSIRL